MDINIKNSQNEVVGKKTLSDKVFGGEINESLIHEVVVAHLANLRRGTHSTKLKSEVRGGGKKPWKQKGTGNARAGSSRSPLWRGGGVTFGPKPRDYSVKVNKKVGQAALRSALSLKAQAEEIVILDNIEVETPKTKTVVDMLEKIETGRKTLIIIEGENENLSLSARNIPGVRVQKVETFNVYDAMNYNTLVCTQGAIDKIEERLG